MYGFDGIPYWKHALYRKGEAEFLHNVGASIVDVAAVDGKDAELGQVGLGKFNQFLGLLVALFLATFELSVEEGKNG